MPYLLESDILIYYTNGVVSIHELIERIAPDGLAVSAVSYMESQQGIGRGPHPEDAQIRLDELLVRVPVVAFSRVEAYRSAGLPETLQQGRRVRQRALDRMIADGAPEQREMGRRSIRCSASSPQSSCGERVLATAGVPRAAALG